MIRIPVLVIGAVSVAALEQAAPPIFRTRADVVVIDVAVMDRTSPVIGLTSPSVCRCRQLSLLMTDGNDTTSIIDAPTVLDTLKYADSQLSFVITRSNEPSGGPFAGIRERRRLTMETLKTAAAWSGGRLVEIDRDDQLSEAFLSVIQGFRSSYVLRYAPEPRLASGWHDVTVTVTDKRYTVRAKRGYWAGGPGNP